MNTKLLTDRYVDKEITKYLLTMEYMYIGNPIQLGEKMTF